MSIANATPFAVACQEAVAALLNAIATAGEQRRGHLAEAKLAVEQASHDAQSSEQWYLADHLRRGIKEVEAFSLDAA
ncbi:hypothetical protein [Mycobacterium deserti]|uniref:Uncharacterized protein n=1 Tax=Mycobacterium deserti TaxID=2978347 RepID=A0ABT2M7U1_9MYCO|nr:hypothetical protein [Mycobacterium deserti]MCT7658332.1 hypothetical protein [Mycobacterium deserti]